jgi:hypothetical protein
LAKDVWETVEPILYVAVEPFDPACGDRWAKYVSWSQLTQLREVISLDGVLCPTIFQELTAEDWKHNVQENFKTHLFRALDYLLGKVAGRDDVNVLALMQQPTRAALDSFADSRFTFRGFDLIERGGSISALVNCGGFAKAFSNADLSACGLLTDLSAAQSAERLLRENYPAEPHANCDVWAIWQMNPATVGRALPDRR